MLIENAVESRPLKTEELEFDLVIIGGGLAGTCAALTASREGLKTVLVQDRPVLGGNASSEVRLWILGATSHMGNNNRWAREGGVVNEILEENLYRNRQGNPLIFDTILLEKCVLEGNLTLLLNTVVFEVEKYNADTISGVHAFCSQNSTRYVLKAPYFCDASGDGIVGFMAGAAFRMGTESKSEFGEGFAPDQSCHGLLGHSIYFYSKDVGVPVKFKAPSWALKNITEIPRFRKIRSNMQGCKFWWLEYGGRLDTVHQTETIKWELWKVVYGVWNYIKNSGRFPDAETMTLEWVGHIPGKRESRRFEGDSMLRQQDVVGQTLFEDVVAHGGWSIDLHPVDGVYSEKSACIQWHSKGVYGIPYSCYYSKNIRNLFLAGRIISATHVAFGSTRVMATCGAGGASVGMAAAVCKGQNCQPRDVSTGKELVELQIRLDRMGQFMPGRELVDQADLALHAKIWASSVLKLGELKGGNDWVNLDFSWAMLMPLHKGTCPEFTFEIDSAQMGSQIVELRRAEKVGNFTPDELIERLEIPVMAGISELKIVFHSAIEREGYHIIKLAENPQVKVRTSDQRLTGLLSLTCAYKKKVASSGLQNPPEGIGIDTFEFYLPQRRPKGKNLAIKVKPPIQLFGEEQIKSGPSRPTQKVNAWVADPDDPEPTLRLEWTERQIISRIIIEFDPDWDHPMESVLITHPEEVVPFMVKDFNLLDADGNVLTEVRDHHGARFELKIDDGVKTTALELRCLSTYGSPAAIFRFRVYL